MNLKTSYSSGIKTKLFVLIMLAGAMLNSCTKSTFVTPMNVGTIRFNNSSYTIEQNAGATTITLPLSLPLEADGTALVTIDSKSTGLSSQYTINPAIPTNGLTLSLAKGATQASFSITSLENFEGDITVVLKLSNATGGLTVANSNATTTITIHGKPIVLPSLTVAPTIINFPATNITTVSASQPFTVTGVKLTSNITVTAPANFKVSLDNITFSSSVSITAAAAMANGVTVNVQFAPSDGINHPETGNITLVSGLLTAAVTVSGTESGNAAPGILISKDDFSYGAAAGALTTASAGKWSAFSAAGANAVQYVATGLTYTGYTGSGVGGALVTENKTASAEDVSYSFAAQTGGVVYVAQLINFTSAPTTADFFAGIGDGIAGATPNYFNRLYAKSSGSQFLIGLARNSAVSTAVSYPATGLDYGTTYLVVTKYEFGTGNSSMYVLSGTIPLIEPATPTVTSSNTTIADPNPLTRLVIRQSTALPLKATYDGVRIATSWKDAVGL